MKRYTYFGIEMEVMTIALLLCCYCYSRLNAKNGHWYLNVCMNACKCVIIVRFLGQFNLATFNAICSQTIFVEQKSRITMCTLESST